MERLHRLQRRTDSTSYAEAVRRSLWVHETLLDLIEGGGSLLVEKDGEITRVSLIGAEA